MFSGSEMMVNRSLDSYNEVFRTRYVIVIYIRSLMIKYGNREALLLRYPLYVWDCRKNNLLFVKRIALGCLKNYFISDGTQNDYLLKLEFFKNYHCHRCYYDYRCFSQCYL